MASRLPHRTPLKAALLAGAAALAFALAAPAAWANANAPVPAKTRVLMSAKEMAPGAPILVRIFKKESVLEVWKQTRAGNYELLKSFPICRWSGQLGPKRREGDRQAPEGFYAVSAKQMNPNSQFHLSFDLGYPNAFDRAQGATGAYLMVHGQCTSSGCYAMTDAQIEEIYALARDAFAGGQRAFQVQAFPFRMTAENMAKHRSDPNIAFWRQLKEGYDHFEATRTEPRVSVVAGRYAFQADGERQTLVASLREKEDERIMKLVEDGAASIRTTYSDGGMNAIFTALAAKSDKSLGVVSRPEALAYAGKELVLTPARKPAIMLANAPEPPPRPPELSEPVEPARDESLIAGASPILPASFTPWPRLTLALR